MEQVVAAICEGDSILVEDIDIWVEEIEFQSGHLGWEGHFALPERINLDVGGSYILKTVDGRSAQIFIKEMPDIRTCYFIVSGTFG